MSLITVDIQPRTLGSSSTNSTSKPSNVQSSEIDDLNMPVGSTVYVEDTNELKVYDGNAWSSVGGVTPSSVGCTFYGDIVTPPESNPYSGKRMQFFQPVVEGSDFSSVANEGFSSNSNGEGITDYTVTIPKSVWNKHLWLVDITIYSTDNAGWYFVTQDGIDAMTSNRLNFYGLALHSSSKRNPNNSLFEQHRLQTIVAGADFSSSFTSQSILPYTTGDGDVTFRIYSVDNNNDIATYSTVDTVSGEGYRNQSKIQITKIR